MISLSRRSTGRTLYILDEPTTGLHTADIHKLLEILQRLVDGGDSVVVIEHNLDVIKSADYIVGDILVLRHVVVDVFLRIAGKFVVA